MRNINKLIILASLLSGVAFADQNMKVSSEKKSVKFNLGSVREAIGAILPGEHINIHQTSNNIVLTGMVSNAEAASQAERIAKEFTAANSKILNFLKIKSGQQVMLRVRIGEIVKKDSGVYNFNKSSFDQLQRDGIISVIAEPNIVAVSGEKAEFLSGGELPVPVSKFGGVAVDYKQYGVKVSFLPLVISENRVRINVEPEYSELAQGNYVDTGSVKVPVIKTRKAKTTIELAPGESFMIAGLTFDKNNNGSRKTHELVISVTPYLVDPIAAKDIRMPTDNYYAPSNLDKKLIGSMSKGAGTDLNTNNKIGFIAE